jgi:hypothetical protein
MMVGMSVRACWLASGPAVIAAGEEVSDRRPQVTGLGVLFCLAVVLVILLVVIIANSWRARRNGGNGNGNGNR